MTSKQDAAVPRTVATIRLREALDAERATSGGNASTPSRIVSFLSGPWLDYIAEPYAVTPATDDALQLLVGAVDDMLDTFDAATEQYVHKNWPVTKRLRQARAALATQQRSEPDGLDVDDPNELDAEELHPNTEWNAAGYD